MKKYQNLFLMMFLILSTLFTTIAYAGLSQRLAITGEAEFRVPADIRVTGISIGQTNGNVYNYAPKYSKETITMGFNLAANTSITYNVTVRNSGDIDQTIYDMTTVSTNNQGVTCSLTGYNKKDVIGYRDSITFGVTCTSAAAAENVNIVLKFDFRKVYYVSYNANGGTNAPSAQIKYENEDLEITSEEPTRSNYSFLGWSDTSNAQTAQYEPGDTYTLNSDKLLYAVWEANTHTVTYNKTTNGGTGENIQETVSYNQSIDLTKTASKTGWTFVGWNTDSTATTALPNLTMGEQDVTLYAIYSKQLTGTFNYYNGESTSVSTTIYNTETSGTITSPAALGGNSTYIFRGWSESNLANASNPILANTSITLSENKTYYASYTYTVTVTWTANGGSTPAKTEETKNAYMNYQGSKVGISFTMPAGTTKTGYTFNGWGTSNYAASSSQTFTANQTLAAQWTVNQYSLTYDVTTNGGTGTNDTVIYDYNESVDLTKTSSKTGYTFVGWNTDSTATTALSTYQMPAGTSILYAIFTPNTYTVTFDENIMDGVELFANNATLEKQDDYYLISGSQPTSGAYISDDVFENGKSYILKYKIQKTDGTLRNIGGHLQHEEEYLKIDGVLQSESYANHPSISDDTNIHTVELKFLCDSTQSSSNSKVYIQPNRALTVPVSVKIFDISLEEVYYTKQVTYDSAYGTLPSPTRTGYTFNGWNGKNLLNMTEWLDSFNTVKRGTATKDNNSVTITATSSDAYTLTYHYMPNYYGYKIPVNANKTYTLSWNTDNQNVDGNVFVFLNDSQENSDIFYTDHKNKKITFTTTSNTKYITFRIGVSSAGSSITYSNIQLEEGSTATAYEPYYVTSSTKVTIPQNHTLTAKWTPINTNISKAYIYDETNNATKCINGEEETCVETKCYEHFNNNSCEQGTIIKYKVNNNEEKYFYVLHDDGNKMTLQQRENTVRNVAWHAESNDNSQGPDTILDSLESATNSWTNVNEIEYTLGTTNLYENKFTGCSRSGSTAICSSNIYTMTKRTARARMITNQEALSTGCLISDYSSCPDWMHNYLYQSTSYGGSYNNDSTNSEVNNYHDYAYWTLSAHSSDGAWRVSRFGVLNFEMTSDLGSGARAVIEIDKQRSSNQYTVTYNGNGSTGGSTATSTHNYDESKALTTNGYTKTGYTFAGWSTSPSDKNIINDDTEYHYDNTSGSAYYDVQRYYLPGPYVAGEVYQVEYDAKGSGNLFNYFHGDSGYLRVANAVQFDGDTKIISTSYDGDNHVQLSSNYRHITARFTLSSTGDGNVRKHLLFRATAGSNLYVKNIKFYKVSSSSMAYTDGQTVKNLAVNGNVNLYAIWKPVESTITLDPKFYTSSSASSASVTPTTSGTTSITSAYNTSLSPTSISMPYTNTIAATNGTIYAITYNNIKYGFEGYYEGKACTGTQRIKSDGTYTNFTSTTYTSDQTLYACWKKINAGADTSASHVNYSCGASSGCPSSSINTVQKALDDLYTKFN